MEKYNDTENYFTKFNLRLKCTEEIYKYLRVAYFMAVISFLMFFGYELIKGYD